MTILDMLTNLHTNNILITKALGTIKDNFTSSVNDNYELTINEKGDLIVKIPSLEKKDEFVDKSISEYEYSLVMCMRISESKNPDKYNFMLAKFMELYKEKLELLFKDVNIVDKLMEKIKKTKNNIDYATYTSIGIMILSTIAVCILTNMSQIVRVIIIVAIILFLIVAIALQLAKERRVKTVIDGYISLIKTEWYRKELTKQYVFLCNFIG